MDITKNRQQYLLLNCQERYSLG